MHSGFVHSGLGRSTGAPSAFRQSQDYGGVSFHRSDDPPHYIHASRGRARSHQPPVGYGSGARQGPRMSSPSRAEDRSERSQSRNRDNSVGVGVIRMEPVGEQEAADWSSQLRNVTNNMATFERLLRQHAQQIADNAEKAIELNDRINNLSNTVDSNDRNFRETCANIQNRYVLNSEFERRLGIESAKFDDIDRRFNQGNETFLEINNRLDALSLMCHAVRDLLQGHPPRPFVASMATPLAHGRREPEQPNLDENRETENNEEAHQTWEATVNQGASPLSPSLGSPMAAAGVPMHEPQVHPAAGGIPRRSTSRLRCRSPTS